MEYYISRQLLIFSENAIRELEILHVSNFIYQTKFIVSSRTGYFTIFKLNEKGFYLAGEVRTTNSSPPLNLKIINQIIGSRSHIKQLTTSTLRLYFGVINRSIPLAKRNLLRIRLLWVLLEIECFEVIVD